MPMAFCIPTPIPIYGKYAPTVLIGEDMYLIVIFAIWPATLYYLLGQYYLIQEVKPRWLLEAM